VPPAKKVEVVLRSPNPQTRENLERYQIYITSLTRAEKISWHVAGEKPKASATALVGDVEVFLPLKGLIDLDEEEKRIQKEIAKLSEELTQVNRKLQNEDFLKKARPEAVEKEKEKARAYIEKVTKFREGLERVQTWKKNSG